MTETLRLKASRVYTVSALVGDIRMYVENMSLAATAWTPDIKAALPMSLSSATALMDRLHMAGVNAEVSPRTA